MQTKQFIAALLTILLLVSAAAAQSTDAPRFEVGAQFSSITVREPDAFPDVPSLNDTPSRTEAGVGGRFTYNFTDAVAVEAEMTFFPRDSGNFSFFGEYTAGRITQGLFGVKAGRRHDKFGVFGKVRPGFVRFSRAFRGTQAVTNSFGSTFFVSDNGGRTSLAVDVGGVVEFYPSRRIVTRFDVGDTIIRFRELTYRFQPPPPAGPVVPPLTTATLPGHTQHNFQFSAGIGIRF